MSSKDQYAVVGCRACDALWIIDQHQYAITTTCARCGTRYDRRDLRVLASADDVAVAREQRGRLLADRADHLDLALDVADYGVLEERLADRFDRDREWFAHSVDAALDGFDQLYAEHVDAHPIGRDRYADLVEDHPLGRERFATHADAAIEQDSVSISLTDDREERADRDASGLEIVTPGGSAQTSLGAIRIADVEPGVSAWLPRFLDALYPPIVRAVRAVVPEGDAADQRAGRVYHALLDALDRGDEASDAAAEAVAYAGAIADLVADAAADPPDVLTSIGTGQGPFNAGREAIVRGPLALLDALDHPLTVRVTLAAEVWVDADPETAQRTLDTLTALARTLRVEVVVGSERLADTLLAVDREWVREHADLTTLPEGSRRRDHAERDDEADADLRERAVEIVEALPAPSGHTRILATLPHDGSREVRALREDPDIVCEDGLAAGSVYRYVGELQARGLIHVDRSDRYNRLATTPLGEQVREYIAADYSLRDPYQRELGARLTPTCQASAGTVYRAHEGRPPPSGPSSPEAWLADTGDPQAEASYVQWLRGPTEVLDAWVMHERITGVKRGDGITLVDDDLERFDDGRVVYCSAFDDELLLTLQWGGPIPTLGRLAGALLSPRALSKVLTEDRVGSRFQDLHDGAIADFEERVDDVVRWGHQVGWFSEDEQQYSDWRDRVGEVRAFLLEKVGELVDSDDYEGERAELIRDLLGLITSATQLYHAAGIDVTVNLRIPDTTALADESRTRDFLGFLNALVPKQTVYKHHSGYRMLLEDREKKLKQRLPYEVDPDEIRMDTTADFIISGPSATQFRDEIATTLRGEADEVREQVREGDEQAAVMELPVRIGNSFKAIKDLVRKYARRKGYQTARSEDVVDARERQDLDRLARLMLRAFNTSDAPHRANPHDVVEALLRIARTDREFDYLSISDLEAGLAGMDPERLLPELRVSTTKIVQVLLGADEPLGMSEIVERAGISERTYQRRYQEAAAVDLLEPVETDGRRRWTATLEPWWAPDRDDVDVAPDPFADRDDGDLRFHPTNTNPRQRDVLSMIALRLAKLTGDEALLASWMETAWPDGALEAYTAPSALDRWRPFLWSVFASSAAIEQRERRDRYITIGRLPDAVDPEQVDLEAALDGSIERDGLPVGVDDHRERPATALEKSTDGGGGRSE